MTIAGWVGAREPAPPPALRDRLLECLGEDGGRAADELPEVAVATAERMLRGMLAAGDTSRATAMDLLVVDSLVTYAFEAAADRPEALAERALAAMRTLSRLSTAAR